ncbi:MAG: hypothetical protein KC657_20230 [Myxococcales bacterium]|nr:hypothetical protein [Myxococcales bacterium]
MRRVLFVAATAILMTVSSAALACRPGPGNGNVGFIDDDDVPTVNNISFQASQLFQRAQMLESSASSRDAEANRMDREASQLQGRARLLRNQAAFVADGDRMTLISMSNELLQQAAQKRMNATSERQQAMSLRTQARTMRARAMQLVRVGNGNGGGWRGRNVKVVPRTVRPAPKVPVDTQI